MPASTRAPTATRPRRPKAARRDAVANARARLIERKTADGAELDRLDEDVAAEMNAAVEHAIAAAGAFDQDSMFRDVYAEGEPRPRPLREHLSMILGEAR